MLSLLIVAVAATTVGLGLVVNVAADRARRLRQSQRAGRDRQPRRGGGQRRSDRRASSVRQGRGDRSRERAGARCDRRPVDLRAQDPHGVFSKPMLRVVSGRYSGRKRRGCRHPRRGDDVQPAGSARRGRSTVARCGWSESSRIPRICRTLSAWSPPARSASPSTRDAALQRRSGERGAPLPSAVRNGAGDHGCPGRTRPSRSATRRSRCLLLATIGLTFIGLLSVAGFTVMAQRRLARARHDRRDRRHRPAGATGHAGQRRGGRRRRLGDRRRVRAGGVVRADPCI